MKRASVLIVDDDVDIRKVLAVTTDAVGFDVTARGGAQ
jgi:hypothetical protein